MTPNSLFRQARLAACLLVVGCYDNPPPRVPRPMLPAMVDGASLDVASHVADERRRVTHSKRVCVGSDCSNVSVTDRETVAVKHASATYAGKPLTLGEAQSLGDPSYLRDWKQLDAMSANCRHAAVPKYVGEILSFGGMLLIIDGAGTADGSVNRPYVIGGVAALVGGVAAYALGKYALGGQDCAEANDIFQRRKTQWRNADQTDVEDELADELATVAQQFNARSGMLKSASEAQ